MFIGNRQAYMVLPALQGHKEKRQAWAALKSAGIKLASAYTDQAKARADAEAATKATQIKWSAEEVLA